MKTLIFTIGASLFSLCCYSQIQFCGMTSSGGENNGGVIFKMDETGNYQLEYQFPNLDFADPWGSKLVKAADGMFYGITAHGGLHNKGVLFQYDPQSSKYTPKYSFKQQTGSEPNCLLQASDGMLYGLTTTGGAADKGTLFQFNLITNSYTKKFDFTYMYGITPFPGLMQASNGRLYGMTTDGGNEDMGVLFEYNPANSAYTKKVDFKSDSIGLKAGSQLIQTPDGLLHAMLHGNTPGFEAAMFQYNPITEAFILKTYIGNINNNGSLGILPIGASLTLAKDGTIYGTTFEGGKSNKGIIFQYTPLTSTYTKKADFNGSNGSNPQGGLVLGNDEMFYGLTSQGGQTQFNGVLFQFNPATSEIIKKIDFNGHNKGTGGYSSGGMTLAANGMLYGIGSPINMTSNGGVIFQYDPATSSFTIQLNSIDFSLNGKSPGGSLIAAKDGMLYGMTQKGGVSDSGTLFQYDLLHHLYTKKVDFNSQRGQIPCGSLMQATDGMLYGMTFFGGYGLSGTFFNYNPSTSVFTKKHNFGNQTDGMYPSASVIQAGNGMIYGMTAFGGEKGRGTLFQYNPTINEHTVMYNFLNDISGSTPKGSLVQATDGMLYGFTSESGQNGIGNGTLFQFNPLTSVYKKKFSFDDPGTDVNPMGSLLLASDGMLYGMTNELGINEKGYLFQYDPVASTLTRKINFDGINGSHPLGSLIQASDGLLYGMTTLGGTHDLGVVFKYDPKSNILTKLFDFNGKNGAYPTGDLMEVPKGVNIDELDFSNAIQVFPNPGNGIFYIEWGEHPNTVSSILNIEILNVLGESVAKLSEQELQASGKFNSTSIDLTHLSPGLYFLTAKTNTGSGTKKLVKH